MMGGACGFTVALIGPDGVGKTTIARRLEREFPAPLKYLYMGDNVETSNVMLPTTRWWKQHQHRRRNGQAAPRSSRPVAVRAVYGKLLLKRPLTVFSVFNDAEDLIGFSTRFTNNRKTLKMIFENDEMAHKFLALNPEVKL